MFGRLKDIGLLKKLRKTLLYSRLRQRLPMGNPSYVDDGDRLEGAERVTIEWPKDIEKPRIGVIRDFGDNPRWTKYVRFLRENSFPHVIFDIQSHDWLEKAADIDVFVGLVSGELSHLEELREKCHFLTADMGKVCFPSPAHVLLYENKRLEAYLSRLRDIPMARTFVSYSWEDALSLVKSLKFPVVSKVDPSSGSMGVELVRSPADARKIIRRAFSRGGRKVQVAYFRQEDYVYFQEFVPNDGFDIRVLIVGNLAFGYYRKVLKGDFRASGTDMVEKRGLPEEAVRTAWPGQSEHQEPSPGWWTWCAALTAPTPSSSFRPPVSWKPPSNLWSKGCRESTSWRAARGCVSSPGAIGQTNSRFGNSF